MEFSELLNIFQSMDTQRQKGTTFEQVIQRWLRTDPRYKDLFSQVWMWKDFPYNGGRPDTGIDLVARTVDDEYVAIQCKCYASSTQISKSDLDTFISTADAGFVIPAEGRKERYGQRLWIATTDKWSSNAEDTLKSQQDGIIRIGLLELSTSPVDWGALLDGSEGAVAQRPGRTPLPHQLKALACAKDHYATHDCGQLIMACGTGKTFTALKIIEALTPENALILYLVPSIALIKQTLNSWFYDARTPIRALCVCSDEQAAVIKHDDDDITDLSVDELPMPATTDADKIASKLQAYRAHFDGRVVIFSTYQSIATITAVQQRGEYVFDFIICDEAHRTAGKDVGSDFTAVHKNEFVNGRKRLYMTATPKIYQPSTKLAAKEKDTLLLSMDDIDTYGAVFYRLDFAHAVQQQLLTDYKILVLATPEETLPDSIRDELYNVPEEQRLFNYEVAGKFIGVINALSKRMVTDCTHTCDTDPKLIKTAIAFTNKIGEINKKGTSKNIARALPYLSDRYHAILTPAEKPQVVSIEAKHIDGTMNMHERDEILQWLKAVPQDGNVCRVLSNVRCLSEGIDVPALDAIIFLASKSSMVDIVQSVGRVMRKAPGKQFGYIIIPIIIPAGQDAETWLNVNAGSFDTLWKVLNAMRSHDEQLNAYINAINLNGNRNQPNGKIIVGLPTLTASQMQGATDAQKPSEKDLQRVIDFQFRDACQTELYGKVVERCGGKGYWTTWAGNIGKIAQNYIGRTSDLIVHDAQSKVLFEDFIKALQQNINPGIDTQQALELLAQQLVTKPIFETLFENYHFDTNNSVSATMQTMIEHLQTKNVDEDALTLENFYNEVRITLTGIEGRQHKQDFIKNLYQNFFQQAFQSKAQQLGIVYTPTQCIRFILRATENVLWSEFEKHLSDEGVNIIDPFTGTGAFIAELLLSGLIRPEDLQRKYVREIYACEILLLAYYVADVNIESVFQEITKGEYVPFNHLLFTDTFQVYERCKQSQEIPFSEYFTQNAKDINALQSTPLQVIIGNPPYSNGANEGSGLFQNMHHPSLEQRITDTYVARTTDVTNKRGLYDSYFKAFRWATEQIDPNTGGVIAFITNNGWIEGNAQSGFRATIATEFDKIYVVDLKGGIRGKRGEEAKREGENIFPIMTGVAITILIKSAGKQSRKAQIYYAPVGDYLSKEQKLVYLEKMNFEDIQWELIEPNSRYDWLHQREDNSPFHQFIPLRPQKKGATDEHTVFAINAIGVGTNRDAWVSNFSREAVETNMQRCIAFYNEQIGQPQITIDDTKIAWTRHLRKDWGNKVRHTFNDKAFVNYIFRPFTKMPLYYDTPFIESAGIFQSLFPTPKHQNKVICVSCVGTLKPLVTFITDCIPDLHFIGDTQCFPLYYYVERVTIPHLHQGTLDGMEDYTSGQDPYIRKNAITPWILQQCRDRYHDTHITHEDVFYYTYALLHHPTYRKTFANYLRRELPRIPLVEDANDFVIFAAIGRQLSELHLHYESLVPPAGGPVKVVLSTPQGPINTLRCPDGVDPYDYFYVSKMQFLDKTDRSTIKYNAYISVTGIPLEAYDYVLNGKSAIEWVMDQYGVKRNSKSGIVNDANMYCREHNDPQYILRLLLAVIDISTQTQQLVSKLPALT